MADNMTKQIRV